MGNPAGMEPVRWIAGKAGRQGAYVTQTNAVVKFGSHVVPARESAAMQYVLQRCPEIPVPVVYDSWTGDDGLGYISMSHMPGKNLHRVWSDLDSKVRESVMGDYNMILHRLRGLDPSPDTPVRIGAIDGGPAVDHRPSDRRSGGPFATEAEFNDWLLSLVHADSQQSHSDFYIESLKACMKDNHRWCLTHGDIGPHNILVENGRITAVLGWELAGWYPEYWEYVKMIQNLPFECRDFKSYARRLWSVGRTMVLYDMEFMIDQTLDSQALHGERVIKQPR